MGWFTRRRDRAVTAALAQINADLIAVVNRATPDRSEWICTTCATAGGHRPGCPDWDRPFPAVDYHPDPDLDSDADEDEREEPTVVGYLPLDWRDQIAQVVPQQADRDAVLALVGGWEAPHALDPGAAYLEGIADTYDIAQASVWGRAIVSTDPAARAALIRVGALFMDDARAYRRIQRRTYPRVSAAQDDLSR